MAAVSHKFEDADVVRVQVNPVTTFLVLAGPVRRIMQFYNSSSNIHATRAERELHRELSQAFFVLGGQICLFHYILSGGLSIRSFENDYILPMPREYHSELGG